MADSLKDKTAKNLFWSAMNNGTMQVLNLLIGIFLGRLLSPGEYGMVGVLTIFTLIAGNLQSSGFTQGLINLKNPTARDYNSVFWFNILASFAIYAVLFCCAPLIAQFFHQPALVALSRFVFLGFVISSFGIAHAAFMNKNLMNRQQAFINCLALAISGVAGITLAFRGYSYWSLAWQQIIYISVLNVGRYYVVPWRPSLKIDFGPVKQMFGFSVKILFTNIINTLSSNILTFIFGRYFPMKQVGNFTQAYKWNTMANSFVANTLWQVVQTVLVAAGDERERRCRVYRKMMRFTAFMSFPLMFGLALVAEEFILCTIGSEWVGSIPLLRILCVAGAFVPFYTMYQNLAISSGRSDLYLWCNVAQIALQVAVIFAFKHMGLTVMVIAYSAFIILWLLAWQVVAKRLIGLRLLHTLLDIVPFMLIAAAVMAATYFATFWIEHHVIVLVARIILAAALYIGAMKLFQAEIMAECLSYLKKKK
ncbi:MAG: lipopolysaccharide biosynthesis protein [Bacteroidales bacterium]|nr:lipopolysaccharide biosynthesis protein [Bacteroidales bacterium]